jgi:hypothetical protein
MGRDLRRANRVCLWCGASVKLFILKNSRRFEYDSCRAFVIRAESEAEAREIGAGKCGDEGADTWRDPVWSTCFELTGNGGSGVVLTDFAAG